ncbi:hypothetical protein CHBEV_107 [Choristoneura biennis entomopoxvirus]|uniref:Uncharacterized protein n=1 Tax=Choristoneura biennis entomopoxvirus TaxID=10288 RepID=A0A916KPY0_CBEPV|nr:hypothetical protein CHBEV_107 [Choristoneura biennis entomopoxvirus]CCU55675.1 hypothetical protein CHBEV_107 [Choristoneura biennis entomopoxvirus]
MPIYSDNITIEIPGFNDEYISSIISFNFNNKLSQIKLYDRPYGHNTVVPGMALGIRWINKCNDVKFELLYNGDYPIQDAKYNLYLSGDDWLQIFSTTNNLIFTRIIYDDQIIIFRQNTLFFNIKKIK